MEAEIGNVISRKNRRIHEMHKADPKRTALLVIDMQQAFIDPEASLNVPGVEKIIPVIAGLIDFCRNENIPVIFTEFVSNPLIPTLRKDPFGPEHLLPEAGEDTGWGLPSGSCIPGTKGPESPVTIKELEPKSDEIVIPAYSLDKFYGTTLDMVLRAKDIRYLAMTGILADLCILATVFSATAREYRVTTVTDGILTIWPDIMKSVNNIMKRKLARLMTAADLKKELS
ncbi:MAG: cysteine hydrolase, partial [Spirochaetaceae bacterium]|nr:cysteine hydrolase [Spirochaetaceae bacterium]